MSRRIKSLKSVTIGSYTPIAPVIISDKAGKDITDGSIYDERMGILARADWTKGSNDYGTNFGRTGSIPLTYFIIIPVMETFIKKLLRLFKLETIDGELIPIPHNITNHVEKHQSKAGYYRFLAIAKDAKRNDWFLQKRTEDVYNGGLMYGLKNPINVTGYQVKKILEYIEEHYASLLTSIGFDLSVSRPSHYVVDHIPVIQNILRKPFSKNNGMVKDTWVTDQYLRMNKNKASPLYIAENWNNIVNNREHDSLYKIFFNSGKKGGPRGKGLSKVGGQIGRSVICPDPDIRPDQIGLPSLMAKNISYRVDVTESNIDEIYQLIEEGNVTHIFNTKFREWMNVKSDHAVKVVPGESQVLRRLQDGDVVIANRQPTLHKFSLLAFEVFLHDESCIYVHPSVTKPFGADFDGDEFNINIPYTQPGLREAKSLMFVTNNMVSSSSSSLLVGYFQDIVLGAQYISLPGTYLSEDQWDELAFIAFENFWMTGSHHADKASRTFDTFDEWKQWHIERCQRHMIDHLSGRGLYSTILDETFNIENSSLRIVDGVFVEGIMNGKNTTNSSDSIGLQMYNTHGPEKTMAWLNLSYLLLNQFLIVKGVTLSYDDVKPSDRQRDAINSILDTSLASPSLHIDPEKEIKSKQVRLENEITEELNSIRDLVKNIVLNDPEEIDLKPTSEVKVYTSDGGVETFDAERVKANFYTGALYIDDRFFPMDIYNRVSFNYEGGTIDRTRVIDNLKLMTRSGARGNETNIVQIGGVIGQQTSGGVRVERSLPYGNLPHSDMSGKRALYTDIFGENSPESRGFIRASYVDGFASSISTFFNLHLVSRYAMSANHVLTPNIGYFERKVKTFCENYKIGDRNVVSDENGNIIMWTYLFDTSKLFTTPEGKTFIDVRYEMTKMKEVKGDTILFLRIKLLKTLASYTLDHLIKYIEDSNDDLIVLSVPSLLISTHLDYYEYLRDVIPHQFPEKSFLLLSGNIDLNDFKFDVAKFIQVSPTLVSLPDLGNSDSVIISSDAYNYPDVKDDFALATTDYNDLSFITRSKTPLMGKVTKT